MRFSLVDPAWQSVWNAKIGWSRSPVDWTSIHTRARGTPTKKKPLSGDQRKKEYRGRDGCCQPPPHRSVT